MSDERVYWCAETDIKRLQPRVAERFAAHLSLMLRSGRLQKARETLSAYYGSGIDGARDSSRLRGAGEDGEVTEMHINSVRSIVNNTVSLIAGNELAMRARARNSDANTLAQTRLAEQLIHAYETTARSQEMELDVVRGGLLASTWTLGQSWMPRDGAEWAVDDQGHPIYEGDIELFVLPFWRVVYDFAASDAAKRKWGAFRRPASRWDLAAQLEEQGRLGDAIKLRKASTTSPWQPVFGQFAGALPVASLSQLDTLFGESLPEEDVVWVYEVRHLPSPALPTGRVVRYVEPDVVLFDSLASQSEYPYSRKDLHLYEYTPERVVTGSCGHTGAFDLGAMQEFLDICSASVATTVNIAGQMQIWSGDTEAPVVRALSTGGTVLNGKTEPKVLAFPALKPEVIQAAEWVSSQMRQAMALNDVVMGQPDKGMPASAQALQRAQAVQFHAVAQGERVRLRERNVNGQLQLLKRFARSPRVTELAGKDRAYELKEWQADNIADVERFTVEAVNPATSSFEGRQATVEMLQQMGALKDPDSLLTFLQTGSLDSVTSTQRAQRELVEAHVALLQRGIGPPPVDMVATQQALMADPAALPVFMQPKGEAVVLMKSDPHHLAIPAYLGVLAAPTSRVDAAIVKACTEAVQFSVQLWASLTQDELAAYGIPPLPSQFMQAGMPPPPPPPSAGEAPPSEPSGSVGTSEGQPPLPRPPEDPLTGQQEDSGSTGLTQ